MNILLTILVLALLAVGFSFLLSPFLGAPPVPTTLATRKKTIELIKKYDPHGKSIGEIGCAWGGFTLTLAKNFPERQVVAVERSIFPFLVAKLRFILAGRKNLKIYRGDGIKFLAENDKFTPDSLFLYLMPGLMARIEPVVKNVGHVMIANSYPLPNTKTIEQVVVGDIARSTLYVYAGGPVVEPAKTKTGDSRT